MWPESKEHNKGAKPELKTGLTTGCCATACCVAAANSFFRNEYNARTVSVTLPNRKKSEDACAVKVVDLVITDLRRDDDRVIASTIKDAGDDPDVTHGAKIWVSLEKIDKQEIIFAAGEGVGTVTRDGLSLNVGEPAINPVPRTMMSEHLENIASEFDYQGGFQVTVGIENGKSLALKTMNPKLGIIGGLSVLGTSGIVRPFSCAAYIASIHQGVDVAIANGIIHIAASTGNLSEQAIQRHYGLDDMALIEMGDFIGALLKHIKARGKRNELLPEKLTICAGFGKLTKLADGHMDLHSRASSINFKKMAVWAKELDLNNHVQDKELQEKILNANTSIEVLNLCQVQKIDLASLVCDEARLRIMSVVPECIEVEVFAVDRKGHFIGSSGGSRSCHD